jgi:cell wall-associated NlpC family hydrolase
MRLRPRALIGAALAVAIALPVGVAAAGSAAAVGPVPAAGVVAAPNGPISFAEGDRDRLIARFRRWYGIRPATGLFGPRTRAAVEQVQQTAGLPVSGLLDDATWAAARAAAPAGPATPEATAAGTSPAADAAPPAADAPAAADAATDADPVQPEDADTQALRDEIIALAASLRGIPYVAGGTTPSSGFDCSGYTSYVFRKAIGMSLPRISRDQYAFSEHISRAQARPGDLVFMYDGGYIHHVSIYAGNGMVWHSPRSGSVVSKVPIWTSSVYFGRVL